jgi:hypothetical protein
MSPYLKNKKKKMLSNNINMNAINTTLANDYTLIEH